MLVFTLPASATVLVSMLKKSAYNKHGVAKVVKAKVTEAKNNTTLMYLVQYFLRWEHDPSYLYNI